MNSFATLLESDAIFPILIILLVILIGVFVFVIYSTKKQEKLLKEKRSIMFDDGDEIKVFNGEEEIFDDELILPLRKDEVNQNKENTFDDTITFDPIIIEEENDIDNPFTEEIPVKRMDEDDTLEDDISIENNIENETNEVNKENQIEITEEKESELIKDQEIEMPKHQYEYTTEKTEIFDFPDFSDIMTSDKDIKDAKLSDLKENIESVSEDVINEANKYIEEIMQNEESEV